MNAVRRVTVGLACCLAVWLLSFGCTDDRIPEAAQDPTGAAPSGEPGRIYLVEVQARPDYRLLAYDSPSATTTPLFVVPEFGALASFATAPTDDRLVLSYTTDYRETGTGLYLLDLQETDAGAITDDENLLEVVPRRADGAYDDLGFAPDGTTVWATLTETDRSAVVAIDVETGETVHRIENAVEPAMGDGWVAYLPVESDGARRSVAVLDLDEGTSTTFDVLDNAFDLGHLVADPTRGRLLFVALYPPDDPAIQIGSPAGAHGAHDGPSQWLSLDLESGEVFQLLEHEPMSVRDATLLANGQLVASVVEGVVAVDAAPGLIFDSRYVTDLAS